MKKIFLFLGIFVLLMSGAAIKAQTTWQIGATVADNVTATLDVNGTLTISGTGAMQDFTITDTPWYAVRSDFTSLVIEQGVTSIGAYAFFFSNNIVGNITIPNSVISISKSAFELCYGLTSITIPSSVISIGDAAFQSCGGLTSVIIPNSVASIGNNAFADCRNLISVTIPNSVTTIGSDAFYDCNSLTSITIPDSVTLIGDGAFSDCSSLISVTISNSVTLIGYSTFSYCSNLKSVTIPNSVTSIGENAFADCCNLISVTIPNSVTTIGSDAFYNCCSLTSLTIPTHISSIGNYAFAACSSLTSITCFNTYPPLLPIGGEIFIGVDKIACSLNVPASSVSLYKAADQWKDFIHINEITTAVENDGIQNLKLFPNPAKDKLYITAESPINKVEIYTLAGSLLVSENNSAGIIDVSSLAKGIYMVKIYTMQGVATMKMIKIFISG